jgi:uncharacterized protein with NRDE domain
MCVVALALHVHPDWPILLVGNRDEFHRRPAAPLHIWDDGSGLIAGRDLEASGTWLGVHPASGRVAVVTNVRGDAPAPDKASRGALVTQLLSGEGPYHAASEAQLDDFNAFNLILVDHGRARIFTNRPTPIIREQASGVIALANQAAFTPCPRAERLGQHLSDLCKRAADPHDMLEILQRRDDPALFIEADLYGTRASTLVMIDHQGRVQIVERRYEAGGRSIGTTALQSQIG